MTGPDPADAEPGDAPTPDGNVAGAGADHAEPTPDEVLHDARLELDAWRASFRMDPLER